jgi:hypothetical protein
MDFRLMRRDGKPAVEWTWGGNDDMDPARCQGSAVVMRDELHSLIFFDCGDDSEFVAKQQNQGRKKPKS